MRRTHSIPAHACLESQYDQWPDTSIETIEPVPDVRVLIPSNRRWYRIVSAGTLVDFEDSMAHLAQVDVLELPSYGNRSRLKALRSGNPVRAVSTPCDHYDLCFLAIFDPEEIRSLTLIKDVRSKCKSLFVYIFDPWPSKIQVLRRYRNIWNMCDRIFVSFPWVVDLYSQHVECPVEYMPQAIDSDRFHPFREDRPIHVLSVGRRLNAVHDHLIDISTQHDLWYHFSEAASPRALDLADSQFLLGRLSQAARIQICWPVEVTDIESPRPGFSQGSPSPITVRWFEAAACGSVVLGSRPQSSEFDDLFPYEGFVRELQTTSRVDIESVVLSALRDEHDRDQRRALANHVRMHHTWRRRCEEILRRA
jgi:hypothetical protein